MMHAGQHADIMQGSFGSESVVFVVEGDEATASAYVGFSVSEDVEEIDVAEFGEYFASF